MPKATKTAKARRPQPVGHKKGGRQKATRTNDDTVEQAPEEEVMLRGLDERIAAIVANQLAKAKEELKSEIADVVSQTLTRAGEPELPTTSTSGISSPLSVQATQTDDSAPPPSDLSTPSQSSSGTQSVGDGATATRNVLLPLVADITAGNSHPAVKMSSNFKTLGDNVPDKIKAQIWANEYVDLTRLVNTDRTDDVQFTLYQAEGSASVNIVPQNKRLPFSILQWDSAFAAFMAVYLQRYQDEMANLLQYSQTIKQLSQKGANWRLYDEKFRKIRETELQPWGTILFDLYLQASIPFQAVKNYQSQNKNGPKNQQQKQPFRPKYRFGVCWKFNDGFQCNGCTHDHKCDGCGGPHPKVRCTQNQQQSRSQNRANTRPSNGRGRANSN